MFFQILVQHRSDKNEQDAEIEPQHKEHDGGQASIGGGKCIECIDIDGIQIGKSDP